MLIVALILLSTQGPRHVHHDSLVITSPYGERVGPISGKVGFHYGVDLVAKFPNGEFKPVYPVWSGQVIFAGWQDDRIPADFTPGEQYRKHGGVGLGQYVKVQLPSGMVATYAHLSQISVSVGDYVDLNTQIGIAGQTGLTTGPHLHLELHNSQGDAVNPMSYLR